MTAAKGESKSDRRMVGVRVDAEIHELLDLAVFFEEGISSLQELLEPVLRDFALSFGSEPEAIAALKAKQEYVARKNKKLLRLDDQAANSS